MRFLYIAEQNHIRGQRDHKEAKRKSLFLSKQEFYATIAPQGFLFAFICYMYPMYVFNCILICHRLASMPLYTLKAPSTTLMCIIHTKFVCEYIFFFFLNKKKTEQVINSLSSLTFSYVFVKQN